MRPGGDDHRAFGLVEALHDVIHRARADEVGDDGEMLTPKALIAPASVKTRKLTQLNSLCIARTARGNRAVRFFLLSLCAKGTTSIFFAPARFACVNSIISDPNRKGKLPLARPANDGCRNDAFVL